MSGVYQRALLGLRASSSAENFPKTGKPRSHGAATQTSGRTCRRGVLFALGTKQERDRGAETLENVLYHCTQQPNSMSLCLSVRYVPNVGEIQPYLC